MSTRTGPQVHRRRARRIAGTAAFLLSFGLHLAIAALILWKVDLERQQIGSENLDVELLAPRLAPPLDPAGRQAKDPGRARSDGVQVRASTSNSRAKTPLKAANQQARRTEDQRRQDDSKAWTRHVSASEARTAARQAAVRSTADSASNVVKHSRPDRPRSPARTSTDHKRKDRGQPRQIARADVEEQQQKPASRPRLDGDTGSVKLPDDPMASMARLQELALKQQDQLAASTVEVPDGPSLNKLVREVRREAADRKLRNQQAHAAVRQQNAEMERRFSEIARRTELRSSVHLAGSAASAGSIGAAGASGAASAARGGSAPLYGLKFYLSGRRVLHSRVVQPPELIASPRLKCKVTSLSITPATVRLLVERSGKIGHSYLKNSSSNKGFDRCALQHVRAMQFKPGVDQFGTPLDVWINVRVEPSTLTARSF